MDNNQIKDLVETYWRKEDMKMPGGFECRFDHDSSAIMYSLIRHFQPRGCLEIGTWLGGSTCIIMKSLQKSGHKFRFVSSEIDDHLREETYTNVFRECGNTPLLIGDITQNLERVPPKIDFLFIDTDHDKEVTVWIIENIFPLLTPNALVVIHDFAVEEINGKWVGKGHNGIGGQEETAYYMELHEKGTWPLKKIYWSYHNPAWDGMSPAWESSFWLYEKTK